MFIAALFTVARIQTTEAPFSRGLDKAVVVHTIYSGTFPSHKKR